MTIDGFTIDERIDLNDNMRLLETHLRANHTFWGRFEKGTEKIRQSMGIKKVHVFVRLLYFILLIPAYFKYLFTKNKIEDFIDSSLYTLEEYYRSPKMRVVRFKMKCALKKAFYQDEIIQLEKELTIQESNSKRPEIGTKTGKAIQEVISSLKEKIESKRIKFDFYKECVEKLESIETQIQVKESLLLSKQKMLEMEDLAVEQSIRNQVETEFELFKSYSNLLDGISNNLKKLRIEKDGLFDLLEVEQMEDEFRSSKNEKA